MQSQLFSQMIRALVLSVIFTGLFTGAALAEQTVYVVKRGDTLSDIARVNRISVAVLADRNGLGRNYHVRIGQRLIIPNSQSSAATPARSEFVSTSIGTNGLSKGQGAAVGDKLKLPVKDSKPTVASNAPAANLPASIKRAINDTPVIPGRWKYIVIHHSGVDEGTVRAMDRYHREVRHMENGLAYHFVIGNGQGMSDGEIAVGNRWANQLDGGHLASLAQNKIAIGICLVGNFDKAPPTAAQMKSLNALVKALMSRCNVPASRVKTHQQINIIGTRCPGKKFPAKSFLAGLK
jgi:murein DD-endopeptidase MepM/ murein hydrolase activator NlpD